MTMMIIMVMKYLLNMFSLIRTVRTADMCVVTTIMTALVMLTSQVKEGGGSHLRLQDASI